MPPKVKSTAPPSDADDPVASSTHRKTRNTTKGETSDMGAPPATIGRKTRKQMKARSKEEDSDQGEMSNATSSTLFEENDSRTPRGIGSESSKTPARELAHVEEAMKIHPMHSNALESSANDITSPEAPLETPKTALACSKIRGAPKPWHGKVRNSLDGVLPVGDGSPTSKAERSDPQLKSGTNSFSLHDPQYPEAQTASPVPAHLSTGQYLHPMNDRCLKRRRDILNGMISISRLEIAEMEAEVEHIDEKIGKERA